MEPRKYISASSTLHPTLFSEESLESLRPDMFEDEDERVTPGLTLGEVLGRGGSAVVRSGLQHSLDREVAIKALRSDNEDPRMKGLLLREAWVTGALEHPSIIPVYDIVADQAGDPLILLKRIQGQTLQALLSDEARMLELADGMDLLEWKLRLLMRLSTVLHFAHSKGVLHRDLKPANVMLGDFGELYLLDWGLAVRTGEFGARHLPHATGQTRPAGTPAFMAPEMLGEGPLTVRSDVYLLGGMLYVMLTGRPPYPGPMPGVFEDIRRSEPPMPRDAPTDLVRLCRRAMHRDPDKRPESADAFRHAISEILLHRERRLQLAFHISRRDIEAAEQLLGELSQAEEELSVQVHQLRAEIDAEQARRQRLESHYRRRDPAIGRRTRVFVLTLLGAVWTVSPVLGHLAEEYSGLGPSHWMTLGRTAFFMVVLAGLGRWARDSLRASVLNRRIIAMLAVALGGQALVEVGGQLMGLPTDITHPLHLLVWSVVSAAGMFTIDLRLWPLMLAQSLGFLLGAWRPDLHHVAASLAGAALALNALWLWGLPLLRHGSVHPKELEEASEPTDGERKGSL